MAKEHSARTKLLQAALRVIRTKGYAATSVDELCETAGVTKGAFFHHFKSKEDLAVAAANYWSETTGAFFDAAPYQQLQDPLDRIFGYLDFRRMILNGSMPEITCLAGTMVQETYDTHPAIREACNASISGHAAKLAIDIDKAIGTHGISAEVTPDSLALFTQAVLQGAFILGKARNNPEIAAECVDHLRRYFEFIFQQSPEETRHGD